MKNRWATLSVARPQTCARRHENSVAHKQVLLKKNIVDGKVVPSKDRFRMALGKVSSGEISARALAKLYGWSVEEAIKVKWCLGEACRRKTAEFLGSTGVVLTVNQDARSHLALREAYWL